VDADPSDADGILKLQYLCYQTEGRRYGDYMIPPLAQTLRSLLEEFPTSVMLAAKIDDEVVGSVRGRLEDETFHIGRLVVHPRLQRRGLGKRLLGTIEQRAGGASRLELFTGHRSQEFLNIYEALGYRRCGVHTVNEKLELVYLEKKAPSCDRV